MRVALQIFSYDEPYQLLKNTMDSYIDCEMPEFVESIDYQACVTPKITSPQAARDHESFEYVHTPPGKLSSRNHAHQLVSETHDIIVVGDADAPPLRNDYLLKLLEPFQNPDVVAVNSNPISDGILGFFIDWATIVEDRVFKHMHGQGSAFRTTAWNEIGPFPETNQTDINHVRKHEEFRFYHDLRQLGEIEFASDALVRNDTRRVRCNIGLGNSKFCNRRGVETFNPED
jgi:cellulose synthase/poly-beta-1,6-N-acetylglucosamine synthase-like glycosyltransferase